MATSSLKVTRKQKQRKNYLDGIARRPHTHSRILKSSFEEVGAASGSSQQETTNESSGSVCPQC